VLSKNCSYRQKPHLKAKQRPKPALPQLRRNDASLTLKPVSAAMPSLIQPAEIPAWQRMVGNQAVQRMLAGQTMALSDDECSCQRRPQNLAVPRLEPMPGAAIQLEIDDGHDLTAPALARDTVLEECFDGKRVLKQGHQDQAVQKLQEALATLGFASTDPPGVYGPGTKQAVIKFQTSAGMSGKDIDGIVGKRTMNALDMALRHGGVEADEDKAADDFKVIGKFVASAEEPDTIFFEYNKAELDTQETKKIEKIANKHKETGLTLEGFASEEGSVKSNAALIERRINAVSAALDKAGHDELRIFDPRPEAGIGNVKYREMRSVKIVPEGQPGTPREKGCPKDKPKNDPCSSKIEAALTIAVEKAVNMISDAEKSLPSAKNTAHVPLFDRLFGTNDATRPKAVTDVKNIMGLMKNHISNLTKPDNHKCGNECDGTCNAGAFAYNRDTQKPGEPEVDNPPGVMTLCPEFTKMEDKLHPVLIIHEGHHGVPGEPSRDYAYNYERLIDKLDTETALKNAATFHIYILRVAGGDLNKVEDSITLLGPKKSDQYSANLKDPKAKTQREALDQAIAWIEHWLKMARFDIANTFEATRDAKDTGTWPNDSGTYVMSEIIAPRFGLTKPNNRPKTEDQRAVAAIFDRVVLMYQPFRSPLSFTKIPTGAASWERGPGKEFTMTQGFFSLTPSQQVTVILQELIHATDGISANLEAEYFGTINDLRIERGWVGPET
jgi:outer membrane protein OmpA-like peptidoglycan-associated protein